MEINQEQLNIINRASLALDEMVDSCSYRDYEIQNQTGLSLSECQAIIRVNKELAILVKTLLISEALQGV